MILENDNCKLVDCTVTWLNMLNKDIQTKILSRLTDENKLEMKKEEVEEEEEEATKDLVIPPPTKVDIEVQTDPTVVKLEALHRETRQLLLHALHR